MISIMSPISQCSAVHILARDSVILEKFQLLAVVSLPQCAFAHFGAGVKASIIFVRKRRANEKSDGDEVIFMAAPNLIGYDATGRKTASQLDEIVAKYDEFKKDATTFFACPPMRMSFASSP